MTRILAKAVSRPREKAFLVVESLRAASAIEAFDHAKDMHLSLG